VVVLMGSSCGSGRADLGGVFFIGTPYMDM